MEDWKDDVGFFLGFFIDPGNNEIGVGARDFIALSLEEREFFTEGLGITDNIKCSIFVEYR